MLRRRMILTIVSSSMLAERSTRISVRLPPSLSPVRYWRSPSPLNSRILAPWFSSSALSASRRLTSSSSDLMSLCSFSIRSILASVSSSYSASSSRNSFISAMISAILPSAVCFSSSRVSIVFFASTMFLRPSSISTSRRLVSAINSVGSSSVDSLTCALIIMNNRITAPKPQLMQSRNDMLKTSNGRRLRAIVGLRHDHSKLVPRATHAYDVPDLETGGPVDLVPVEKRAVAAEILHDALAVAALYGAMSAGYTGHVASQVDPPLTGHGLRPHQQGTAINRVGCVLEQQVRGLPGRHRGFALVDAHG